MTSFLALHWALVFALLGYLCIGHGIGAALAMLGGDGASHRLAADGLSVVPVAVAVFLVAALFLWVFVEACLGSADRETMDGLVKIAFVGAGALFSLVLIGGAASGVTGLSGVVLHLVALMACYLAVLGERWTASSSGRVVRDEIRESARAMARGAADTSLLGRISGRPELGKGR